MRSIAERAIRRIKSCRQSRRFLFTRRVNDCVVVEGWAGGGLPDTRIDGSRGEEWTIKMYAREHLFVPFSAPVS